MENAASKNKKNIDKYLKDSDSEDSKIFFIDVLNLVITSESIVTNMPMASEHNSISPRITDVHLKNLTKNVDRQHLINQAIKKDMASSSSSNSKAMDSSSSSVSKAMGSSSSSNSKTMDLPPIAVTGHKRMATLKERLRKNLKRHREPSDSDITSDSNTESKVMASNSSSHVTNDSSEIIKKRRTDSDTDSDTGLGLKRKKTKKIKRITRNSKKNLNKNLNKNLDLRFNFF
jgi:hypothetical protein